MCGYFPHHGQGGERGGDAVGAAGEEREAISHLLVRLRLGQDAPADGDHRVGGQEERGRPLPRSGGGAGLRFGEALRIGAGEFAAVDGFVDAGGPDRAGHDARLGEQGQAARTFARENEQGRAKGAT